MEPIRIATVYTGMPVSLVATVENEIKRALKDVPITFLTLSDPSIISEVVQNGSPTPGAARRLAALLMMAVQENADIVLNGCSSVGDIADAAAPLFAAMGVKLLRIDEYMARVTVRNHARIGVLATLNSTLEPTKALVRRIAAEEGRKVEIVDALADGAFGVSAEQLEKMLLEKTASLVDQVDCFLLAQGSMASSEAAIAQATGKPAYSSPRFAAQAIAQAVSEMQ